MKAYLDSCVVIYRVEGQEPFSRAVAAALRQAPGAEFCISDLVRMECLVDPLRRRDDARRQLFEVQCDLLTRLPLDRAVFDLAAEIRAHRGLKVPDALHGAAAIVHGCDELWTGDKRFDPLSDRLQVRVIAA